MVCGWLCDSLQGGSEVCGDRGNSSFGTKHLWIENCSHSTDEYLCVQGTVVGDPENSKMSMTKSDP